MDALFDLLRSIGTLCFFWLQITNTEASKMEEVD